jgi:hypothetical protein
MSYDVTALRSLLCVSRTDFEIGLDSSISKLNCRLGEPIRLRQGCCGEGQMQVIGTADRHHSAIILTLSAVASDIWYLRNGSLCNVAISARRAGRRDSVSVDASRGKYVCTAAEYLVEQHHNERFISACVIKQYWVSFDRIVTVMRPAALLHIDCMSALRTHRVTCISASCVQAILCQTL